MDPSHQLDFEMLSVLEILKISLDNCQILLCHLNAYLAAGDSNAVSRPSTRLLERFDHSQSEFGILSFLSFLAAQTLPENLGSLLRLLW
jgi:hypothetical protein